MEARRCGVLGSPIEHSLSPVLHRAAYAALDLDWAYDAYEVDQPGLADFLTALTPSWRGLSLTMPLKRQALALCDRVDSEARATGSVNTVVLADDRSRHGFNTDVAGVVGALGSAGVRQVGRVVVVGAGATASSVVAAVARLGCRRADILPRTPERATWLVDVGSACGVEVQVVPLAAFAAGEEQIQAADVVVSTVPASAQGRFADSLVRCAPVVFDVVYDPPRTPLLTAAESAGCTVVAGLEMLLHQAARQVELMVGVGTAPVEAMRAAAVTALGAR